MATTTLTLGDMVEETLSNMYRGSERPRPVVIGSTALSSTTDTTFTVDDATLIPPTTIVEAPDGEQMLVTDVSDDATPVITVMRAYNNTTAESAFPTNTVLLVEPRWGRADVSRWIQRWFAGPGNTYFPTITSQVMNRETDLQWIEMPADTMRVIRVRHYSTLTGRIVDIGGWQLEERIPTAAAGGVGTTGVVLRLPSVITNDDEVIVEWIEPSSWSGIGEPYEFGDDVDEAATIEIPVGAEDLPVLYAAAYGIGRREVTRVELDKVQEWNQEQAARAGINLRLLRDMWGEYYRRVDEARKIQVVPKHRPYRKMAKVMR